MPGFGFTPFGRRPFSTIVDLALPAAVAAAAVAAGVVFTVEIHPVSGSPIYVASRQYDTLATDSLPNTSFNGTLEKALRFKRSIIDGQHIGGMSSGFSEIEINNPSGEYDSYANSLDGAHVIVRMGQLGLSYDRFVTLYDGIVDGAATIDEETMLLHLFDDNKRLDIPAQPSVYGGTGGIDGDSNVVGKRKPIMLGAARNATMPLIDAANLVYQYHDGPAGGILAVYDRGITLTVNSTPDYANYAALIAATITPGRYASCFALGIVRLGAKADGLVTITAWGAIDNGLVAGGALGTPGMSPSLADTASCIHYLITVSAANIVVDAGSVIALKAAQAAQIGYFIGPDDNKTLRQAIDEMTYGILAWAGFRRDRTFDMGLVALPTGSPLGDYTEQDFFTLKQKPLPAMMSPPPYRIRAAYGVNFTVQPDLDAVLDAGTQTLRKDKFSIASSNNASLSASIRAAHPQAQDPDVWPSFFVSSADAVAFCNATLTFMGGATRILCEIVLPADAYALNIANPIKATDDRYGLSGGKALAIMGIDDDTSQEEATVQGIG